MVTVANPQAEAPLKGVGGGGENRILGVWLQRLRMTRQEQIRALTMDQLRISGWGEALIAADPRSILAGEMSGGWSSLLGFFKGLREEGRIDLGFYIVC